MKYFSKLLSMLLVGAMLVSTACTDYAEDIKNTNERVDKVEADVKDILELLDKIECEHGDALDAIIAGHCDDLAGLAEDIQDANDKILALQGVDADLKKSIEFINSLLKELAGTEDESKLLSAMATWNALLDGLKVFYETQLEGLLSDVESAKAFMAAINETLNNYKATYSQKAGMAAVVEDLETVIAKFQALEKEFAQYKEDTAVEFSKVYAAIASLGSVQSIVYVPEYSDGCATIDYALINDMIVEARSTMEFMVTPASGAGKIVSMFEANPESLAIVHEDLKERLNTRSAEHLFNIAKVYTKAGEADRLFVEFDARHLTPEFYNGEQSLALSLVYNAGNEGDVTSEANVASCFVKTIATTKPEVLKYDIVATVEGKKTFVTNDLADTHYIQYNNKPREAEDGESVQEIPVTLADMHKVAFYAEGFEKEYRTFEQMIEQGYDLTLVNDVKPTDKAGYKKDFTNCVGVVKNTDEPLVITGDKKDGVHTYHKSEIAKDCQKKDYVGFVGTYKYNYIVESNYYKYDPAVTLDAETNDLTPNDFYVLSNVVISKLAVPVSLNDVNIDWDYKKDVAEDAKGEADARYSRTGIKLPELPSRLNEKLKNVESGAMAYQLIADGAAPKSVNYVVVGEEGETDRNPDLSDATARVRHDVPNCMHDAGECAYLLDIENFQWDGWKENKANDDYKRTYLVEMIYETEYLVLSIFVNVHTTDRARAAVAVDYETFSELVYHSNMKFTFDGNNDLLDNLWDARTLGDQAKHYASVTKAEWLKDNFVTNELKSDSDKDSKFASMLAFDIVEDKKYEFNVVYDYADETGIVNSTKLYKKDINTWYGQEFTLNKTIEFQSPDYTFYGTEEYLINGDVEARPHYQPVLPTGFVADDASWLEKHPLSVFSIERMNMFGAFDLQKIHTKEFEDRIVLPSSAEHANCGFTIKEYVSKYADADVVDTPANKKANKEKDANYKTYDAGVLKMPKDVNKDHSLYQDAAGNWHYNYVDVLRPMFKTTGVVDTEHIKFNLADAMNEYTYALAYYGWDKSVAVDADLYIVNSNDSQFRVDTNFDANFVNANPYEYSINTAYLADYSDFDALQYCPFREFVATESELVKEVSAAVHHYDLRVAKAFSLKDKRGAELINHADGLDGLAPFFVTGNGKNGFAENVYVGDVFGFPYLNEDCNHVDDRDNIEQPKEELSLYFDFDKSNIPAEMLSLFTFGTNTGILSFDFNPELTLQKDLVIPVTVYFGSSWNCNMNIDNVEPGHPSYDPKKDYRLKQQTSIRIKQVKL